MKGKRKFIRETRDYLFIRNAAQNGDREALRILNRYIEINKTQNYIKKNFDRFKSSDRLKYIDSVIAMEKEKQSMLYYYDLQKKKAKIYLDTLKRKRREERTEPKDIELTY